KWHISKAVLRTGEVNHSRSLEPFGFSDWESHGDRVGLMLEGYYQDDAIAAGAVGWLRQHGAAANRDGTPWFLTVSFINPHDIQWADVDPEDENIQNSPSVAPRLRKPPSTGLYTRRWETPPPVGFGQPLNAPGRPAAHAEFVAAWADLVGAIPGDRADMWRTHNDFYLNLLRDNDRSVGAVLNGLEELGMADNTIVVFTSDHGEHAGAHGGLRNKGPGAYDGHIHVPLLVAHPEGPRGTACDALTSSVDMMPTLFALAGGSGEQLEELCGELSGQSFAGLVGAPSRDADSFRQEGLLYCYDGLLVVDRAFVGKATAAVLAGKPDSELRPDFSKRGLQRTFFDGRYKFSRYFAPDRFNTPTSLEALIRDNDIELFDCQQDPDEMTNLAFGPARDNELIMRLNGRLNTLLAKEVGPDDGGAVSESIAHWGRWPIASG
ncbi:MAG: sulfatase-like hydrolase/transferase, partial [Pseudomonadota bacterium]|nr:sulfatase-like hydrolase/transferase [Pseudomonadota bacterium]